MEFPISILHMKCGLNAKIGAFARTEGFEALDLGFNPISALFPYILINVRRFYHSFQKGKADNFPSENYPSEVSFWGF